VDGAGVVHLNKKRVNMDELLHELVELRRDDPDLSVILRGDSKTKYQRILGVMDALQQANVVKVDLATEPAGKN
jgi:biopolymer transport protein ExbD